MPGIAIYVAMELFRTPDSDSDLNALSPTLQGFPMCVMLSHFHERQEMRDTEPTLRAASLQCQPSLARDCIF